MVGVFGIIPMKKIRPKIISSQGLGHEHQKPNQVQMPVGYHEILDVN